MNKCAIFPIRTGSAKEVLGNRVFNCSVDGNLVNIWDDKQERVINQFCISDVQFVNEDDIVMKYDLTMWLA